MWSAQRGVEPLPLARVQATLRADMISRPSAMLALSALLVSDCGSDDSGGGGDGTGSLKAPIIEMVMPMSPGGLHVTWKNQQADCSEIEAERKSPTQEYAVVFTVPGAADNKHDGTATDNVEYTYRLRCKRGGEYSSYSNEMSGTP